MEESASSSPSLPHNPPSYSAERTSSSTLYKILARIGVFVTIPSPQPSILLCSADILRRQKRLIEGFEKVPTTSLKPSLTLPSPSQTTPISRRHLQVHPPSRSQQQTEPTSRRPLRGPTEFQKPTPRKPSPSPTVFKSPTPRPTEFKRPTPRKPTPSPTYFKSNRLSSAYFFTPTIPTQLPPSNRVIPSL